MIAPGDSADDLEDGLAIAFDLRVAKAQDAETLRSQPGVACAVIGVKRAIRLDNQPMSDTNEVRDVRADRDLAAKFQVSATPVPQQAP